MQFFALKQPAFWFWRKWCAEKYIIFVFTIVGSIFEEHSSIVVIVIGTYIL
jgi:hypothetical protein